MRLAFLFIYLFSANLTWAQVDLNADPSALTVITRPRNNQGASNLRAVDMIDGIQKGAVTPLWAANNSSGFAEDCDYLDVNNSFSRLTEDVIGRCLTSNRQLLYSPVTRTAISPISMNSSGLGAVQLNIIGDYTTSIRYHGPPPSKVKCDCVLQDRSIVASLFKNNATDPFVHAINTNLKRMEQLLEAERNAMRFQASTIAETTEGSMWSTANYTLSNINIRQELIKVRANLIDSRKRSKLETEGIQKVELSGIPDDDFLLDDAQRSPGLCIPMRAFLASKQIPRDNAFYKDLSTLTSFNESDWNYRTLHEQFIRAASNKTSLDEALQVPELKAIYERMQFLHNNPLFKNLFSAPGRKNKKEILFAKIKEIFTPKDRCWEDSSAHSACIARMRNANVYTKIQNETRSFFSDPSIIDMTRDGAKENVESILKKAPQTLQSLVSENELTLWNSAVNQSGASSSADYNAGTDLGAHIQYCLYNETNQYASEVRVETEIEKKFGDSFASDPFKNDEYIRLNNRLCNSRLADSDGSKMSYEDFKNDRCPGAGEICQPHKEMELLALYLDGLHDKNLSDHEDNSILALSTVSKVTFPSLNEQERQSAKALGQNSRLYQTPASRLAMEKVRTTPSGALGPVSKSDSTALRSPASSSPSSSSSSSSSSSNSAPDLGGQQFVAGPMLPISSSPTEASRVSTTTEVARQELVRSETEIRSIQNDISSLSTNLQRELSKGPTDRDSDLVRDLNTRLDQMNARLDSALANNQRLQADLEKAEAQNASRAASERTRSSGNDEDLPRAASASQNQTGNTQAPLNNQQTQVVSNTQAPVFRSSESARLAAPVSTRSTSSGQATGGEILSNLAASGSSVSAAPSIVVATSSQGEYMRLLAQTIGNEVTQVVPADVFNSIASSSPDPRLIQSTLGSSLPASGQVGRFQIKKEGTSDEVEMLISRTGEQYSITFGKRVGAAPEVNQQRAPASADGVRLIDLQQAVQRENE